MMMMMMIAQRWRDEQLSEWRIEIWSAVLLNKNVNDMSDHCKCYLFSLVTPVHSVHVWIALFCWFEQIKWWWWCQCSLLRHWRSGHNTVNMLNRKLAIWQSHRSRVPHRRRVAGTGGIQSNLHRLSNGKGSFYPRFHRTAYTGSFYFLIIFKELHENQQQTLQMECWTCSL